MKLSDPGMRQIVFDYMDAIFEKDVDKLIGLYDEDAMIFDLWNVGSYYGKTEWTKVNREWLSSLGSNRIRVDFIDQQYEINGNAANLLAFVSYKEVDSRDLELQRLKIRLTWILARAGDKWYIKHQHGSAPIDRGTRRGLLDFLY